MSKSEKWGRFLDCLAWSALATFIVLPLLFIIGGLVALTMDTPWAGGLMSAWVLALVVTALSCNRLSKGRR